MDMTKQINVDIEEIKQNIKELLEHARRMVLSGTEFESYATALKHKITDLEKTLDGQYRIGAVVDEPEPKTRTRTLADKPVDKTIILDDKGSQQVIENAKIEEKINAEPCTF